MTKLNKNTIEPIKKYDCWI